MKALAFILLSIFSQFSRVYALSPAFIDCQLQKPASSSPLEGCPAGTLYVSPSDSRANYTSVQQAVLSLPDSGDATILVGAGEYFEMVNVTRTDPLTLLGQLDPSTAFDPAGNASTRNLVQIWNNLYVKDNLTDEETATLTVAPAGQPFGNVNFRAYNIDFENRAANYSISQALVTSIMYANASFYGCAFASYQDTWYTGHGASTYAVDSIIYGQTDYLFGFGTAWFQSVTLANRACGGGITAWQGTNDTRYGAYISDSRIIRSPDANATTVTDYSCYLGRPWNVLAVAVYLRTYMDESIQPVGFTPWDGETTVPNTTYYAEYDSYGLGGNTSARVPQDHILTNIQAQNFTMDDVFLGRPSWIDYEYVY
ncbi:carbohydrate esterase family 8 protein [Serpula lacrymans var. lacrymans S7.3]|uniref:pectinesterase n=2 Tax=Serpula lacrymans var. lacrymans TaxID=341189 RepID=F8Q1H1_SERL3|nr:carbohydrate esterase family 8 protein [Serpula lacrymans var. lacrymans S7.9]EGN98149.1 carbohydrate esterase family 8 protein [Serpula lacrymans var. lacrymans S7.3]EGO23725.1 carbohydrate esterase family 8 protein [Serpula lacrymans var. lacrymans S7.9]